MIENIEINLTAEDLMVASTKAAIRQLMAIKYNRIGHDHGSRSNRKMAQRIGDSVIGNLGEMAVSRYLDKPITSNFEDIKAKDIDGKLEIRTTEYKTGCLLLHDSSPDESIYILVVVNELNAKICGWIEAKNGKLKEYWKDGDPGCYYVPQSKLKSINLLR